MTSDISRLRINGAPTLATTTESLVVGNPTLVDELLRLIQAQGTSQAPFRLVTPWNAVTLPLTTHVIGGLNLDGDAHPDFLVLLSANIYAEPNATAGHRTASFLMRVAGTAESSALGAPTAAMLEHGALLAAGLHDGTGHPITDLLISRMPNGRHAVAYRAYHADFGTYEERIAGDEAHTAMTPEEQFAADHTLFTTLAAVQGYMLNSVGYLDALKGAQFSAGSPATEAIYQDATQLTHWLATPLRELSRRYAAVSADPALVAHYQAKDPDLLPFTKATHLATQRELLYSQADQEAVTALASRSEKLLNDGLAAYRWKGNPDAAITRAEFYQLLRDLPDPADRRQLLEEYSAAALRAHQQGLVPMIGELNTIAQKYGFANYAEYAGKVLFGIAPDDFDKLAKDFHATNEAKIVAFIGELTRLNGGQPVNEWDVHHLADALAKEKLQGREIPKLTFADGLTAAKAFFLDLGMDLDQPPFAGQILFDTNKREDKYGNAFATTIGDGKRAWFNTNFDPTEEISLEDLGTIVHELVHDIHMIQAAQRAKGSTAFGINGNPSIWTEGIAVAVDRLVTTKGWMDRYLAHLPQFQDDAIRAAIAQAGEGLATYEQMMILSRARFEINLYQDKNPDGTPRPMAERLGFWQHWVRQYMHVEAMDSAQGGHVWATPHFAGMPGYYVSYQGGFPTALKAAEPIYTGVATGSAEHLKTGGAQLLHLFGLGARLTSIGEIEQAITALQR